MNLQRVLVPAIATFFMSGAALAQDDDGEAHSTYFSVLGTYVFEVDSDRNTPLTDMDDGSGAQFILGQQRASGFGFELPFSMDVFETGANNGTDFYRYNLGLDIVYGFGDRTGFTPFVLLGGGGTYNDVFPDDDDDFAFYANGGLGFVTGAMNQYGMKLRAEVRYIYDDFGPGLEDIRAGLGLEFALRGASEVITETIESVKVIEVPAEGGFGDDDGDGVINDRDQCPDTPMGTRVDGDGCPLGDVIALDGVHFKFNKAELQPDARTILNDVARILNRYPEMIVEVAGHTDSVGSDEYNQGLSQRRAQSVLNYLTSTGVDGGRLSAVGYGESEPRATNDTEDGRELNRRVELRIKN